MTKLSVLNKNYFVKFKIASCEKIYKINRHLYHNIQPRAVKLGNF